MTKAKPVLRRLLRLVLGLGGVTAMYYFCSALASGKVPLRFQIFVMDGWVLLFFCALFLVERYRERRFLGSAWKQPFVVQPDEEVIFSTYRAGIFLYPRAEDYTPRIPLGVMIGEKKPLFFGGPFTRIRLTNRRLMLRSWFGNTWRIIPVSGIDRVLEAPRRFSFLLRRVIVDYHLESHREVLVVEDKRVGGKTLKEALLGLGLSLRGEPSGRSPSDPPDKTSQM
jgi:hypothetical protein